MANAKPKYGLIAEKLMRDISNGLLPVGELLPTETELMRAYGVSRHTIRTALQELRTRGVVASQRGQGSKVIASNERAVFAESIQSIDELITFGQEETRRILVRSEVVEAETELAQMFGCKVGRRLVQVRMLRKTTEPESRTIAVVTLWLDALLESVVRDLAEAQKSAAEIIRHRFGYDTNCVDQTIQADSLDPDSAAALDAKPGDPALVITRSYATNCDKEPFLVARSLCKADALRVVSRFTSQKLS